MNVPLCTVQNGLRGPVLIFSEGNGGGSAEGTPTSGECDRMIWHHCRRFGVSACEYGAYAIRGRLFNFAQYGFLAGQRLCPARLSRGFSYIAAAGLEIKTQHGVRY
jgi:hypothetical protein